MAAMWTVGMVCNKTLEQGQGTLLQNQHAEINATNKISKSYSRCYQNVNETSSNYITELYVCKVINEIVLNLHNIIV